MKNYIKSGFKFLLFIILPLGTFAQSTSDNNIAATNKFLGYNGSGANLEFRTNNQTYMQLMQNGNSTINTFSVNRSGFLGLSQDATFFSSGVQSPFSLLHLNGYNNETSLFSI